MSTNTYLDLEQVSDTSVETIIVYEDEKFKEQRFLNTMLCFGFLFFCLFVSVLIQFNFFSY